MKNDHADIAIVAANYNNGKYLKEFIESILSSSIIPSQVIIVDDGSVDESIHVLKEYEKLPIACFIYSEKNEGFAIALNKGLAAVKTKYVMRADPDDILYPSKIESQLHFLENNPQICAVGCNVEYFHNGSDKILNKSNFPLTVEDINTTYLKGEHGLQHPTVLIRSDAIKEYRYRQEYVPAEDYDLFSRLIERGYQFMNISDALYKMRIHETSASTNIRFDTIKKTFELREKIFKKKTSLFKIKMYFYYILNYRRYLIEKNIIKKVIFLGISIFCYPNKLIKRVFIWQH
ncbi:glycosyltransferase [candidate division KSB1 bacterium]